ncbi:MAG: hypothetical protein JXA42_25195 [Anaerolineales bacterium]|nr:hypothetical protein [Anaerolineales bacterium]
MTTKNFRSIILSPSDQDLNQIVNSDIGKIVEIWHKFNSSVIEALYEERRHMLYRVAVEDIEPNHWVAWILDLPACFSSAQTQASAIALVPEQISTYYSWLQGHDGSLPVVTEPGQVEVEIVETFNSFPSTQDPDYVVNAFF